MVPMVEVVSIPVPREGNDTNASSYLPVLSQFQSPFPVRGTTRHISAFSRPCAVSIPVPLAGNDDPAMRTWILRCMFQSPFPSRGTTQCEKRFRLLDKFQSPFPSRGTTDCVISAYIHQSVSIPRSPRGERHLIKICFVIHVHVSIPVPLAGNDHQAAPERLPRNCFNPRSPRGERRKCTLTAFRTLRFQSPFPSRGTTGIDVDDFRQSHVSIPVPLAGNDLQCVAVSEPMACFNPRSPRGERR